MHREIENWFRSISIPGDSDNQLFYFPLRRLLLAIQSPALLLPFPPNSATTRAAPLNLVVGPYQA